MVFNNAAVVIVFNHAVVFIVVFSHAAVVTVALPLSKMMTTKSCITQVGV